MRAVALAFLFGLSATTAWAAADPMQAHAPSMEFVPPAPGTYQLQRIQRVPDALLRDARDRQRRLGTLTRGKVTLLTFFYTYCVDEWGCPFAYRTMVGLRDELTRRGQAGRVRFVSISFDPTHDTPDVLWRYGVGPKADSGLVWEFLTARNMAELVPLLEDFGQDVRVEKDASGRPMRTINHMLKLFLIDRDGVVREIYALDYLHPAMMINDIETLLMEERRPPGRTLRRFRMPRAGKDGTGPARR